MSCTHEWIEYEEYGITVVYCAQCGAVPYSDPVFDDSEIDYDEWLRGI